MNSQDAFAPMQGLLNALLSYQTSSAYPRISGVVWKPSITGFPCHIKAEVKGIADALAARDADRSRNGKDNHDPGTGVRRQAPPARECTYQDFMKCKPLYYEIEKYVGDLPDMIHGSVMASKPMTMQDAIEFVTELMDKKFRTLAERQAENKRKLDNNNQAQQQPPKNQGVSIAYTSGPGERKESPATTNNQRNLTCYECGNQGHYRSDCPELNNQNHGNQDGGTRAQGMVHALGGRETNQDFNDMEDDINA
ncbi:hypothetical protein Tco_0711854 [Tanacetum coccineum]